MKVSKLILLTALSTTAMTSFTSIAIAEDNKPTLEEIIITSQYRSKGLQDVPISVSAVNTKMMEEAAIVKIEDLTTLVPNFTYSENGISTTFLVRGIGSGANQGFEQSVGVYIDGVNYPRAQQVRAPFLDLERVEVLRGPQSILFGKNSVAGALNITTAKPTSELEGSIFGSYEFVDSEYIIEGVLSGPLSDRLRARVAGRYRNFDGFIQNATLSRDEPNRKETTLRGTVEFDATENLTATAKIEVSDFDSYGRNMEIENAGPADLPGSPLNGLTYPQILVWVFGQDESSLNSIHDGVRSSNGDSSLNKMQNYQLDLDWDTNGFGLKSITSYSIFGYDEICDCDFTGANVFSAGLQENYNQFSQEFRLTSPIGNSFDYILGAYLQTSHHKYSDQIMIDPNSVLIPAINAVSPGAGDLMSNTQAARQAKVDATILSAFFQLDWHIQENLTLQLGGRITNDNKDGSRVMDIQAVGGGLLPIDQIAAPIVYANLFGISSTNLSSLGPTGSFFIGQLGEGEIAPPENMNETKFSPDVKLVWDINDETMLYASWARGFKSGGFDFRANNKGVSATSAEAFQFDDENATNYEIGGKFKLGNAAEISATAYFTKFDNLQISIFDGILGFNVGNAASSEVKGIEVDGRWALNNRIRLTGGAAVTDFKFNDFKNGQCFVEIPDFIIQSPDADGKCDFTGLKNNLVSNFSGNIGIDFDYPIMNDYELTGLANLFYASSYGTSQTHDPFGIQDGFVKINARIAFGPIDGPWEIAILGKNLTDEIVKTYNGEAPLAGETFRAKTNYTFFGQGRTITIQGHFKF